MRRPWFFSFIVGLQLCFIVLHIHKQSMMVKRSYEKQRLENYKQELIDKKNSLLQQWYKTQQHAAVKEYATTVLGMKKISLKNIKQIPHEHIV